MLIRLLCAQEMTKHVCKISHLNSKRLLKKLQKNVRGLLYFAAPCTEGLLQFEASKTFNAANCMISLVVKVCVHKQEDEVMQRNSDQKMYTYVLLTACGSLYSGYTIAYLKSMSKNCCTQAPLVQCL